MLVLLYSVEAMRSVSMQTRINKFGDSLSVWIPGEFAKDLNLKEGMDLDVSIVDGGLLLRTCPEEKTPEKTRTDELRIEEEFCSLVDTWREETGMYSSISSKVQHPAYKRIIEMGEKALPLILRELRDRPAYWFEALKAISKQTPVPPSDRTDVMRTRELWLNWGKERGLLE